MYVDLEMGAAIGARARLDAGCAKLWRSLLAAFPLHAAHHNTITRFKAHVYLSSLANGATQRKTHAHRQPKTRTAAVGARPRPSSVALRQEAATSSTRA